MDTLSTVLRAAAVLAVMLLAGLGILFVLDLIPRETLTELSIKFVAVIGILAAAGLVMGLLIKDRNSNNK